MKLLITGGTGFLGSSLIQHLSERGHSVHVLTRNPKKAMTQLGPAVRAFPWNPETEPAPKDAFEGVDTVIHLAGEPVGAGRWTAETKNRILNSRTLGTRNLVATFNSLTKKPSALISASAVGFYGSRGESVLDENASAGSGFLAQVCESWEGEARKAGVVRNLTLRIGVVLGKGGGALEKILPPFKLGAGGKLGDGRQYISWIHQRDLIEIILQAIENPKMNGVYNATAPDPVRNEEFTADLGKILGRPTVMSVPKFALKLMFGEMADETLLASQRVEPRRILETGFEYKFPRLTLALKDLLA